MSCLLSNACFIYVYVGALISILMIFVLFGFICIFLPKVNIKLYR